MKFKKSLSAVLIKNWLVAEFGSPVRAIAMVPTLFFRPLSASLLMALSVDFLGAGVAIGYGVALFDKAKVPQSEDLVKQVKNISSISEIVYADGSVIASIESDLLRTSVSSEEISDNLKKAIVATEDEHFLEHNGGCPKKL